MHHLLVAAVKVPAIDPVVSLIVGAFGAAVIGLVGALIGAWIQGRREHSRWVRERRFDAYREFLRVTERSPGPDVPADDFSAYLDEATEAVASVMLVGPDSALAAARAHDKAMSEVGFALQEMEGRNGDDEFYAAREKYRATIERLQETRAVFLAVAKNRLGMND